MILHNDHFVSDEEKLAVVPNSKVCAVCGGETEMLVFDKCQADVQLMKSFSENVSKAPAYNGIYILYRCKNCGTLKAIKRKYA